VAIDAGYKTPYISKLLMDVNIHPVMPYTKDSFMIDTNMLKYRNIPQSVIKPCEIPLRLEVLP
jgi:hypothetical protein